MARTLLLLVHILSVMVAFGAAVTVGIWAGRAHANPTHLRFTLDVLDKLDRALIDPFYTLAGVTGVVLVHLTGVPWSTTWVIVSFVLWIVSAGLSHGLLRPTMKKLSLALESVGHDHAEYRALASRAQLAGNLLMAIAIVLTALMVWKPL